jgi:PPK2 family polyphosphate:nucleotide phosphotransferase
MNAIDRLRVKPGSRVRLSEKSAGGTPGGCGRERAEASIEAAMPELRDLQYRLFAEGRRSLLVILQGMDAAGKDGVVRHVLSGLNPQGCRVTSFKAPSAVERQHDFLWRVHQAVPARGEIGVFNRSHYEDVLVVRVHGLVPPEVWKPRYEAINRFEHHLTENGVTVVKCLLHISRAEQTERLLARLKDPERNWKFSPADIEERRYWRAYRDAYEEMLSRCSTPWAPWYVIPADHKWYRNWAVAEILRATMSEMKPRVPAPLHDVRRLRRILLRDGSR